MGTLQPLKKLELGVKSQRDTLFDLDRKMIININLLLDLGNPLERILQWLLIQKSLALVVNNA